MEAITLSKTSATLRGTLALNGSKSISNRALIALALAGADPATWLSNLSTAKDTVTLNALLSQHGDTYDAGDAGTTFRFLAAYLAIKPGRQTLTGSARMLERPIGPLVDALRTLGVDIQYLGKEGYPPLLIGEPDPLATTTRQIRVEANVSSQFLSALLLIGPYLPHGLELIPEGPLVSRPYLEMTVKMMRYFGAEVSWQGDAIEVQAGAYTPRNLAVEADWSGASYWYAMAVFSDDLELRLEGLHADSWQGDAALVDMVHKFGIQSVFEQNTLVLTKSGVSPRSFFEQDFLECPDIAQTLAVVCAGLGITGAFFRSRNAFHQRNRSHCGAENRIGESGRFLRQTPGAHEQTFSGKNLLPSARKSCLGGATALCHLRRSPDGDGFCGVGDVRSHCY